jgi:cysteinyl-tRNA synthetase
MKLYLYNTLTRKKEEFKPIKDNEIGLYTCGPTVYNYAHIGNLRSYVFADILVRTLRYNFGEEKVKWVMNITDIDDKTIRDSKIKYPDLDPKEALQKFTKEYANLFWQDMEELNVKKPDAITHATDPKYLEEMQKLIKKIVETGYGYIKDGSVYFDVKKFSQSHKYGNLINLDMAGFKSGVRIDADEYEKENVQDFVLWKGYKEGEPSWDFELNGEKLPGRPGWHIECSAMGEAELGCPFDIHTGGIDLKFPHHENEIAQSLIGYNCEQPVNYWVHNEFLLVDGVKMSKRYKNFYTLRDLEAKNINPLAFRFLCMQTNYGKQMNFTFEGLKAAEEGLKHLLNQLRELGINSGSIIKNFKDQFTKAIYDDLNMPMALATVQEMLKSDELLKEDKLATFIEFDKVLGFDIYHVKEQIPDEIEKLRMERLRAREKNNFEESDKLRDEIEKLGYIVEDTKDGQRIYKK